MKEASLGRKILLGFSGGLIGACYGWAAASCFPIESLGKAAITAVVAVGLAVLAVGLPNSQKPTPSTFHQFALILFAPPAFLAAVFVVGFFFVMMCCLLPFMAFASFRRERKFRQRMMEQGRYSKVEDLQRQLLQGEGTLIEETGPKGAFHIWWTPDVLEGAPSSLSHEDWEAAFSDAARESFHARCVDRYLDETKGTALLTSISPRLANSGELARKFPQVKRAVVIHFG